MKKLCLLLIFMLTVATCTAVASDITVTIDGEKIVFDTPPTIINGRTLVPMRKIFETLGMEVIWNSETRSVIAENEENKIQLQIDNYEMTSNGEKIALDVAPTIINERTLVPVRAVSSASGCTVDWDGDTRTVIINRTKKETPEKKPEANINKETASITEFNDGDVTLNNKEIKELISEILFVQYDYYENNTNTIFEKESVYINNLTNKDKLFLASKTSDFDSLIKKRITIETLCDTGVNISKKEIDTILEDRFNTSVEVYEPFTYNIYIKDKYEKTVRFTYENDKYIGTCYTSTNTIETSTQQKVVSATKNKKQLYIDVKVVFVNQTGIYKDPSFTTLITTGNESFEEYIEKGNTYRYTYDLSGTSYSLTNVSLLK